MHRCSTCCRLVASVVQAAAGAKAAAQRLASWAVSTLSGSDSDTEETNPSAPAPEAPPQVDKTTEQKANESEAAKPQKAPAEAAAQPPSKPEPAQALVPEPAQPPLLSGPDERPLLPEEPTRRAPPPKLPVPPPSPMEARMEAKKRDAEAAQQQASAPAKVVEAPVAMAMGMCHMFVCKLRHTSHATALCDHLL